jgi:Mn-dependent DtxR family transcriptional regulator
MKRFESKEDYLEKILQLSKEKDGVHSIDIARAMNFSKPSVSVAMSKLRDEKLITIDKDGHIHLTPQGLEIAEKTLEKHELLAQMFINLGVSETTAYEDACKVEHDISDETWEAIKKHAKK